MFLKKTHLPRLDPSNLASLQKSIIWKSHRETCPKVSSTSLHTMTCNCVKTEAFRIWYLFEESKKRIVYQKTLACPDHVPFVDAPLDNTTKQVEKDYEYLPVGDGLYRRIEALELSCLKKNETAEISTRLPALSEVQNENIPIKRRNANGDTVEFDSDDSDLLKIKFENNDKTSNLKRQKIENIKNRNKPITEKVLKDLKFPNLFQLDK